ncbi:response regulator receiver protein [Catenovulum agarivorans DS-2]|uniref:Response regulator receiver protein n=1 Tax=Catenovulum agarivorans DS-2 TaxID=1328313 RepID=W7QA50_9ALTE|nr:response regulator [Catenovulum agarivorans]EWH09679.1 response regulator receiver protein [Catenovulum agarivorans DS-2]
MNILLVDDNASVRGVLAQALETHGYQVTTADNGLAGLNAAKNGCYDFIVTDYKMPIIDGVKLIENITTDLKFPKSKVLLLTTEVSDKAKFIFEKLKINWLAKPVEAAQLLKQLPQVPTPQIA